MWRWNVRRSSPKLRVFWSKVKAMLLYGVEPWRMTKKLKQKLQVFVNKCLRSIMQIWWSRQIWNDGLWRHTDRAVVNSGGDKRMNVGMDWPHPERTRWASCQDNPWVETAGEVQERERDPNTLGGTQRCQNLKREGFRGMRQKSLLKIQSGFEH